MLNLDIAVSSFWQLARHWKSGEPAKIELDCEGGNLNIQLSARLSHPDSVHFPASSPASTQSSYKRMSPSKLRRQKRRREEALHEAEKANPMEENMSNQSEKVLILLQKRLSQYLKNSWSTSLLKSQQKSLCNLSVNIVTTESDVKLYKENT